MIRSATRVTLLLVSAVLPTSVLAQDKAELPKPETVFEQYVEATGGKAAYEKFKNRVSTGTFEIAGANVKGKMTVTQASPNKTLSVTDLGQIGKSSQGTDGETAWETSTFTGERILDGDEREVSLNQALFNSEINWKKRFEKVETVAIEDLNGKPAVKLVLTRKSGKPLVEYYELASHLVVKQIITTNSPMGEMTIESNIGDYKKVDGVLIPHSVKQKVLGQEMIVTFTDIKHNVDLPEDTFALPKEIVAIQKKKAK